MIVYYSFGYRYSWHISHVMWLTRQYCSRCGYNYIGDVCYNDDSWQVEYFPPCGDYDRQFSWVLRSRRWCGWRKKAKRQLLYAVKCVESVESRINKIRSYSQVSTRFERSPTRNDLRNVHAPCCCYVPLHHCCWNLEQKFRDQKACPDA